MMKPGTFGETDLKKWWRCAGLIGLDPYEKRIPALDNAARSLSRPGHLPGEGPVFQLHQGQVLSGRGHPGAHWEDRFHDLRDHDA